MLRERRWLRTQQWLTSWLGAMTSMTLGGLARKAVEERQTTVGVGKAILERQGRRQRRSGSIRVEVHPARKGNLPALRALWNECLKAAPEHQQLYSYDWFEAWLRSNIRGIEPCGWTGDARILVARDIRDRVCAILPLAHNIRHGLSWWALGGNYEPVRGFICLAGVEVEVCDAFVCTMLAMQRTGEFYRFGPLDSAAPENVALLDALRRQRANSFLIDVCRNITIRDLPKSSGEFEQIVRKRSSLKRIQSYERKLHRDGDFQIRRFTNPKNAELTQVLGDCSAVELASWMPALGGKMRFAEQRGFDFWERVCNAQLSTHDQVEVLIGYFNGTPIAFDFSLWCGRICYTLAGNFDEKFSQYRVGSILFLRALENAVARGVNYIDMAPGNLEYKERWGGCEEDMRVELFLAPNGVVPKMLLKLANIPRMKKFIRYRFGA